jgi:hypothetical protein
MMLSFSRPPIAGAVFLFAMFGVAPATAQTRYHVTRDPAELFAAFVRERQALDDRTHASLELTHVLTYHTDYPPADVETLLRELENFALTGTPQWLRGETVLRLSLIGSSRVPRPTAGIFVRLDRVYRGTSDATVRSAVVKAMGGLTERRQAAGFLERIAKQEPADFAESQRRALESLMRLGTEGQTSLKRLHDTDAVRDPKAKVALKQLAKEGYRRP